LNNSPPYPGKGITSAKPCSAHSLVLGVDDIDAGRDDLTPAAST
jgi:hypothetical protein